MSSIREIVFKEDASPTLGSVFALVFDQVIPGDTGSVKLAVNFSTWQGKRVQMQTIMQTINERADKRALNDFSRLSVWESNIFHTIVNNANNWQVTDYFFIFSENENPSVLKVWA